MALGAVGGTSDLRLQSLAGDATRGRGPVLIFGSTLGSPRQRLRSEVRVPSVRKLEPGKREWVARCVDKVPVQEWAGRSGSQVSLEFCDLKQIVILCPEPSLTVKGT